MNLRNYFPKSNYARILITTRLRDAKQKYGTGRDSAIHLDPLGGGEAKELLLLTADLEVAVGQEESVCELLQVCVHHWNTSDLPLNSPLGAALPSSGSRPSRRCDFQDPVDSSHWRVECW